MPLTLICDPISSYFEISKMLLKVTIYVYVKQRVQVAVFSVFDIIIAKLELISISMSFALILETFSNYFENSKMLFEKFEH